MCQTARYQYLFASIQEAMMNLQSEELKTNSQIRHVSISTKFDGVT